MPSIGADKPRSLADDLRARKNSEIEELLCLRPDLVSAGVTDIRTLASVAADPLSVTRALDDLSQRQLELTEVLSAIEDPFTPEQAAAAARLGDITDELHELRLRGLVWGAPQDLHVTRFLREAFGPYPCSLAPRLADRKPQLLTWERDPASVTQVCAALPPSAAELLQNLVWAGPALKHPQAQRPIDVDKPNGDVALLLARGLLVAIDDDTVVVPREVALPLRGNVWLVAQRGSHGSAAELHQDRMTRLPLSQTPHTQIANVESTAAARGYVCVRSMIALLDYISSESLRLSRTRTLLRQNLAWAATTIRRDVEFTASLVAVAIVCNMIAIDPDEPDCLTITAAAEEWLSLPLGEQWVALAGGWIENCGSAALMQSTGILDLARHMLRDVQSAEVLIVAAFEAWCALPLGVGIANVDLDDWLHELRPRIASGTSSQLHHWVNVAESIGICVQGAISQAARTLGHGGESASALIEDALPAPINTLLVQPDNTVIVPGRPSEGTLAMLQKYGDIETEDSALVVRITQGSVNRGLYAGGHTDEFLTFLESHSSTPVGQALVYLLVDQQRRFGNLKAMRARCVIVGQDADEISRLLGDPRLAPLGLRRINATALACDMDTEDALVQLRAAGCSPIMDAEGINVSGRRQLRRMSANLWRASDAKKLRAARLAHALTASAVVQSSGDAQSSNTVPLTGSILDRLVNAQETQRAISLVYTQADGQMRRASATVVHLADGFTTFYSREDGVVKTVSTSRISSVE
jgi:Helicase conserved C-terminal domain